MLCGMSIRKNSRVMHEWVIAWSGDCRESRLSGVVGQGLAKEITGTGLRLGLGNMGITPGGGFLGHEIKISRRNNFFPRYQRNLSSTAESCDESNVQDRFICG